MGWHVCHSLGPSQRSIKGSGKDGGVKQSAAAKAVHMRVWRLEKECFREAMFSAHVQRR